MDERHQTLTSRRPVVVAVEEAMDWSYALYLLPLIVAAVVSAVLVVVAWHRHRAAGAMPAALLMAAVTEWLLAAMLEIRADPGSILFWAKARYLGIVAVPMAWLVFALAYTGQRRWLTPRNLALLTIEPVATLLLVATNEWHHLIWSKVVLERAGPFLTLHTAHGPAFWVHTAYSYLLLGAGGLVMIRALARDRRMYRGQAPALLAAMLVPLLGNALYLSGLNPLPYLDLTPFFFAVSGAVVIWTLFRYRLFDLMPAARSAAIAGMTDAVLVLDAQNRLADLNPAARALVGDGAAEAIGQPVEQILTGRPDLVERYRDVTEAEGEIALEVGGARRDFDLRVSPLYDQAARLTGRLIVLRDSTGRKRAEEALRRHALAFEHISDSLVLSDLDGRIVDCNPAAARMFGYPAEELVGKTAGDLLWPGKSAALMAEIVAAVQRDGRWSGETRFVQRSGLERVSDTVVVPLADAQGQQTALIWVSHDITERKRSEAELIGQKMLFENLVAVARATAEYTTLEEMLRGMLNVSATLTGAEGSSILLLDEAGEVTHSILSNTRQPGAQSMTRSVMDRGLAGWVVHQRQAARIDDAAEDKRWLPQPDAPFVVRSALAVPIVSGPALLGVLTLTHSVPGHFSAEHSRLLQAAADQMALALRNAQIYEEQRQLARRQSILSGMLRALSGHLAPPAVVQVAVETAARLTGWPAVALLLHKEPEGTLVARAATGLLVPSTGWSALLDQGVIARAFDSAEAQCSGDICDAAGPAALRSQMAVPLRRGQSVLGVLVMGSDQPDFFVREDVLLARSLAEAIALALDRAQLHAETRQHLQEQTALREAVAAISSSIELQTVLDHVAEQLRRAVGASSAHIYDTDRVAGLPIQVGLSEPQSSSGRLFLPLQSRGQVIGYAEVGESQRGFTPEQVALCQAIAQQAALAIENARLFQTRERQVTELSILNEIGRAFSLALQLPELLEVVERQVSRLFDTTNFFIALYHEETDEWETAFDTEDGRRLAPQRHKVGAGLTGYIIRNKMPLLFRDRAQVVAFHDGLGMPLIGRVALSWLGVPLVAAGRVIGVMAIQSYEQEGLYGEHDLALFSTVAAQAAIAIQDSHLFQENRRRLDVLTTLFQVEGAIVSTLDRQEVLNIVCREAVHLLGATSAYVSDWVAEKHTATVVADYVGPEASPAERASDMGSTYVEEEGTAEQLNRGLPYTIYLSDPDLLPSKRWHLEQYGGKSVLVLPFATRGRTIGFIEVWESRRERVFTENEVFMGLNLAALAGIAMANADLFEEVRQARDAAEAASRAKSTFLANMSHELRTPLTAIIGYSELLQEEARDLGYNALAPDLEKIRGAGGHLLGVINDILDLSKIEAGRIEVHLETLEVEPLIADVVATVQPLVSKSANVLTVDAEAELGTMHTDGAKVRQILVNLLGNAAKFTDQGRITLTVLRERAGVSEGAAAAAPGAADGDWLVFRVSDTGIGMSPQQLESLFQPFVQADGSVTRRYGGSGLGLAISQRFCQLLGGQIGVESEPGHGSTFTVRLPAQVWANP